MDRLDVVETLLEELSNVPLTATQAARIFDFVLQNVVLQHHNSVFWGDRMLLLDKSADFLSDPIFRKALKEADSSTGANQYQSPDGIAWRYNTLIWAARNCLSLPGDYVECGTYRGDMAWMISELVDFKSLGKKLYLYDTFSGFDSRYTSQADFPDAPQLHDFLQTVYKSPGIEEYVRKRFCNRDDVIVTSGTVPDILKFVVPEQLAFLHLDLNSAKAEVGALDILFDRLSPGGIVIFDDYGWKEFHKQKEAADSFASGRSQTILELPTGQGLLIKR